MVLDLLPEVESPVLCADDSDSVARQGGFAGAFRESGSA